MPRGFVHGILLGYRVLYKVADGINNSVASTSASTRNEELQGLRKFTIYEITVLAFTRIGNGANSTSVFVSTDEDSKSKQISSEGGITKRGQRGLSSPLSPLSSLGNTQVLYQLRVSYTFLASVLLFFFSALYLRF